jgi:hypothetical protein
MREEVWEGMLNAHEVLDPVEILYIASLLGDRCRPIDDYIDYFGGRRGAGGGGVAGPAGPTRHEDA